MREVLGGKIHSRLAALKGGVSSADNGRLGGSCLSLSTVGSMRPQTRSCSLETILDDTAPLTQKQLFMSDDSLVSCVHSNRSQDDSCAITTPNIHSGFTSKSTLNLSENAPESVPRKRRSTVSLSGLSSTQRLRILRPQSVGSCLDIVVETREEDVKESHLQGRAASCLDVNTPVEQHHSSSASHPSTSRHSLSSFSSSPASNVQRSHSTMEPSGPRTASSTANLWRLPAPVVVRRCLSSLDVSKLTRNVSLFKPSVCVPTSNPQPKPEHSKTLPSTCACVSACLLIKLTPSNI